MKKLSKKQIEEKDKLGEALDEKHAALIDAIEEYNETAEVTWQKVKAAIEAYDGALDAARDFRDGIVSDMESYRDEKSDKWRESDAGDQYESWISAWSVDLDSRAEETLEEPGPLDAPEVATGEEFLNLPDEME